MKNTATPAQASESWADAMRTLRPRPPAPRRRRAHPPRLRRRHRRARHLGGRAGDRAVRRDLPRPARLRRPPVRSRRGAAHARPQACVRRVRSSDRWSSTAPWPPTPPISCPRPSSRRRCRASMKPADVAELLDRIPATTPLELRDRALFELAYACGLRAEELVNLDHGSIDFDAEQVRVEGKGGKTRFVPAGEHALAARRRLPRARAHGAAGQYAGPRAVPLQVREAPLDVRRPPPPAGLGAPRGDPGERPSARPPALVRDSSSGGRCRSTGHPGDARPQLHIDDPGLHSGRVRSLACRVSAQPSAGLKGAGSGHQRQSTRAQRPLAEIQGRGV